MALEAANVVWGSVRAIPEGRAMAGFVAETVLETLTGSGQRVQDVDAPWKNTVLGLGIGKSTKGGEVVYTRENQDAVALGVAAISIFDELAERNLPIDVNVVLEKCREWLEMSPDTLQRYAQIANPENPEQTLFQYYAEAIAAEEAYKKELKTSTPNDGSVWDRYLALSTESNSVPLIFALYAESVNEGYLVESCWELWRDMSKVSRILTDLRDPGNVAEDLRKDWGNVAIVRRMFDEEVGSLSESGQLLLEDADELHRSVLERMRNLSETPANAFVRKYYLNMVSVLKLMGKMSGVENGLRKLDEKSASGGIKEP